MSDVAPAATRLIAERRADAFYTCGSNRLLQLMKRVGKAHGIPGQVAMEQVMACGLGPCYVCVRTFEVDGKQYVAIAAYFAADALPQLSQHFFKQADEEDEHALRFINYVVDVGGRLAGIDPRLDERDLAVAVRAWIGSWFRSSRARSLSWGRSRTMSATRCWHRCWHGAGSRCPARWPTASAQGTPRRTR